MFSSRNVFNDLLLLLKRTAESKRDRCRRCTFCAITTAGVSNPVTLLHKQENLFQRKIYLDSNQLINKVKKLFKKTLKF